MGIEPTLSAWEAEVLPLNYTRPYPKGMDTLPPKGQYIIPTGLLQLQTHLTIGHHVEVCTLSRRGDLFIPYPGHYNTAFAFSTILYPLW